MPSRFDRDTIREYFEWAQRTGKKRVGSIEALTEHARKSGNNDLEIRDWLFPVSSAQMIPCPTCRGAGQIPEPDQLPESCYMCKSARRILSYDPDNDKEEEWPCLVCRSEAYQKEVLSRGRHLRPVIKLTSDREMTSFANIEIERAESTGDATDEPGGN